MISIHAPSPGLAPHVLCHVLRTGAPADAGETLFPATFYTGLTITHGGGIVDASTGLAYPRLALCGAQTLPKRLRYRPSTQATTVLFKPGRMNGFFGVPEAAALNTVLDATAVLEHGITTRLMALGAPVGDGVASVRALERLLIEVHGERAQKANVFHQHLDPVMPRLPEMRVGDLGRHFGWVPRTVQRRFIQEFGLPPKMFGRLVRLHEALWRIQTSTQAEHNWAELASQTGFSDQAHFHREFRSLVGLSPSGLVAELKRDAGAKWAFRLPDDVVGWCHLT